MASSDENSGEEDLYRSRFQTWDGEGDSEGRFNKKRKGRACDTCRRRKTKCDGARTSDQTCTNCVTLKTPCTYAEPSKRLTPIPRGYVENLKDRIRTLEGILSELFPNADIQAKDLTTAKLRRSSLIPETSLTPDSVTDRPSSSPENVAQPSSDNNIKQESEPPCWLHSRRFHGQSSGAMFLLDALDMKLGSPDAETDSSNPNIFCRYTVGLSAITNQFRKENTNNSLIREPPPEFIFPPEDLMDSLVSLFFENIAILLPILHRPTFYAQYYAQLYTKDPEFAAVLLLVCATAARYSEDNRVLPADQEIYLKGDGEIWFYAGSDYYAQVYHLLSRPLTQAPSLSDLQKCALACFYLQGSKTVSHGWCLAGFGIRLALEAGAHRRKRGEILTRESQLWNRAFWSLIILDRLGSANTGRPCALYDEDIDVDLPVAVDDEYWDHPDLAQAWKQPAGQPALVEAFRAMLKLLEILTFTLRTVYSSTKSKQMLGLVGPSWEQRVVSELDSALNKWRDSMPDHLRWNPQQDNRSFFNQSALLNCMYYQVQTLVHRPFIPIKTASSPLSFSSLAICTNAARSSSHILDTHIRKGGMLPPMNACAFTSGIVLLLNIWGVKKLGVRADPERHMQDVFKCMSYLKAHSKRWAKAKLALDILSELLSAGNFPQPHPSPPSDVLAGTKRRHDDITAATSKPTSTFATSEALVQDALFPSVTSPISEQASSVPSHAVLSPQAPGSWQAAGVTQMDLPFTTEDLSLLPLYPELYYALGPMQSTTSDANPGYTSVPFTDSAEGADVQSDSASASLGWPGGMVRASLTGSKTISSSDMGSVEQGQSLASGSGVNQPFHADPETFLGQDTLSMWATAPSSFETQDWDEFAQGFQLEEQLRLADIFSDKAS